MGNMANSEDPDEMLQVTDWQQSFFNNQFTNMIGFNVAFNIFSVM